MAADQIPPIHDPLSLKHISRLLFEAVNGHEDGFNIFFANLKGNLYPPIIHFSALPFIFIFGPDKGAEFSYGFYLALMLLSAYGIGNFLKGYRAGILAASFVMLTPLIDSFSRVYMVDFPLAAVVTFSIFLLFRTEGFSNRKYVLFLSIATLGGSFIKQTFLFYTLPIFLLYIILFAIKQLKTERNNTSVNLSIFVGAAFCIPTIIHLPGIIDTLAQRAQINAYYNEIENPSYQILSYFSLLYAKALGPVISLGALLGLSQNIRTRFYWILLVWGAVPIFFIDAFHPFVTPRYLLPVLPAFGIIFAVGLDSMADKITSIAGNIISILSVLVVASWFTVALVTPDAKPFSFEDFHFRFQENGMVKPSKLNWEVSGAAEVIVGFSDRGMTVILNNSPYSEVLQDAILSRRPYFKIDTVIERISIGHTPEELKTDKAVDLYFSNADLLLFHENWMNDTSVVNYSGPIDQDVINRIFAGFDRTRDDFEMVGRFPYPEKGGCLLLFARKNTSANDSKTDLE